MNNSERRVVVVHPRRSWNVNNPESQISYSPLDTLHMHHGGGGSSDDMVLAKQKSQSGR